MEGRTLEEDEWTKRSGLIFSILPKGRVPSSKASPCTFISNRGRGRCAVEVNNNGADAGHVHALPATFFDPIGKFGVAKQAH